MIKAKQRQIDQQIASSGLLGNLSSSVYCSRKASQPRAVALTDVWVFNDLLKHSASMQTSSHSVQSQTASREPH